MWMPIALAPSPDACVTLSQWLQGRTAIAAAGVYPSPSSPPPPTRPNRVRRRRTDGENGIVLEVGHKEHAGAPHGQPRLRTTPAAHELSYNTAK